MTATDILRRLLDERGVEWEATADAPDSLTTWATGSDTARWCADELINDRFDLYAYNVDEDVSGLTPTQAIDATLGRGTCHRKRSKDGLSVRCELDVHYLTDEQLEMVREHVETLQDENAKLREYVTELETANLDVTARLADYIGQYDPTDAFVAELKAENEKLRNELDFCLKYAPKCDECEAMLDCDECLRADTSHKERKRLDYENAELRELVEDMVTEMRGLGVDFKRVGWCDYADRMHELGVEINE